MRKQIASLFDKLNENSYNSITFFRRGCRYEKKFSDLSSDIDNTLKRLNFLCNEQNKIYTVAILGAISYDWIVSDLACIKGGFLSVAIPETLPYHKIKEILNNVQPNLVLLDYSFKEKSNLTSCFKNVYYIECFSNKEENNFENISIPHKADINPCSILKDYSIVFSSGTSEKIKYINKSFLDIDAKTKSNFFSKSQQYIAYKKSFLSRKDNKLIIFMPFSHPQQRDYFRMALLYNISIILSDPLSYQKHIILEKPNILISVPIVYKVMANRISEKLARLSGFKKSLFKLFNATKINCLSNKNPLKKIFSNYLFADIKKIYGGRADYFVSGSAPIPSQIIKTFYSIGVKILQGYGQTEIGNIALSSHKHFKIGSVGKPLVEIKIGDDSEILVKYDSKKHSHNRDMLSIDDNGYIRTGDLGYLDKNNFLFITGRKDEVIVLKTGEKVYPERIENELIKYDSIRDAFIFSLDGYRISVVLDSLRIFESCGYNKILREVNSLLLDYEKIEKYHIAQEAFSIENGLLTSTYKKKKKSLQNLYSHKQFTNVY